MRFLTPGHHGLSPAARRLLDAYEAAGKSDVTYIDVAWQETGSDNGAYAPKAASQGFRREDRA